MSNDNKPDNDALQSGEGDLALGQDERAFGAGGQKVQRPLDGNDAPDRDAARDGTLPHDAQPSSRQD
jgi:hypothetical protein